MSMESAGGAGSWTPGSRIQVFTLDRERDGTIVEVLIVARGRVREEHRLGRWPAGAYRQAKDSIREKNELLLSGLAVG